MDPPVDWGRVSFDVSQWLDKLRRAADESVSGSASPASKAGASSLPPSSNASKSGLPSSAAAMSPAHEAKRLLAQLSDQLELPVSSVMSPKRPSSSSSSSAVSSSVFSPPGSYSNGTPSSPSASSVMSLLQSKLPPHIQQLLTANLTDDQPSTTSRPDSAHSSAPSQNRMNEKEDEDEDGRPSRWKQLFPQAQIHPKEVQNVDDVSQAFEAKLDSLLAKSFSSVPLMSSKSNASSASKYATMTSNANSSDTMPSPASSVMSKNSSLAHDNESELERKRRIRAEREARVRATKEAAEEDAKRKRTEALRALETERARREAAAKAAEAERAHRAFVEEQQRRMEEEAAARAKEEVILLRKKLEEEKRRAIEARERELEMEKVAQQKRELEAQLAQLKMAKERKAKQDLSRLVARIFDGWLKETVRTRQNAEKFQRQHNSRQVARCFVRWHALYHHAVTQRAEAQRLQQIAQLEKMEITAKLAETSRIRRRVFSKWKSSCEKRKVQREVEAEAKRIREEHQRRQERIAKVVEKLAVATVSELEPRTDAPPAPYDVSRTMTPSSASSSASSSSTSANTGRPPATPLTATQTPQTANRREYDAKMATTTVAEMTRRAEAREARKKEYEAQMARIKEERVKAAATEEAAKKQAEADEKRRKAEEEAAKKKALEDARLHAAAQLERAVAFANRSLLRRLGMQPWKALVELHRSQHQAADQHSNKVAVQHGLSMWKKAYEHRIVCRTAKRLLKKWRYFMHQRDATIQQVLQRVDLDSAKQFVFRKWLRLFEHRYAERNAREAVDMEKAASHYRRRVLHGCIQEWRSWVEEEQLNRERFAMRQRFSERIKDILQDL